MGKSMLMIFYTWLIFCMAVPAFSQETLTVDDVLFLVEMGVPEDEVIAKIKESQTKFELTDTDIQKLQEKGVSQKIMMAMGYVPLLTADTIIGLVQSGESEENIISLIKNTSNMPPYKMEDWLKLRRASVSQNILREIKAKLQPAQKVTLEEIVKWHNEGIKQEEIVRRIEERGLCDVDLNANNLLMLKKAGVPNGVIQYLVKKRPLKPKTYNSATTTPDEPKTVKPEIPVKPETPVKNETHFTPDQKWQIFNHLGAAFSISYPSTWYFRSKLDDSGYPQYLFTEYKEGEWDSIPQGFTVAAFPIEDETGVSDEHLMDIVLNYIKEEEPGLEVSKQIKIKLSDKDAVGVAYQGKMSKQKDVAVTGALITAVHQEAVFMITYYAPKEQWEKYLPIYNHMANSFISPAKVELLRPETAPKTTAKERVRDVTDKLRPSVVIVYLPDRDKLGKITGIMGFGSGFIIREDGYVITNRHVVDPSMMGLKKPIATDVLLGWDKTLGYEEIPASVVVVSEKYDLALLKINKPGKYQPILLADIDEARSGDEIIVLGFPNPSQLGTYDMNVNHGTLTALEHDTKGRVSRIRHSAQTTGGNSGGPLYDLDLGGVVGVHTWGLYEPSRMNKGAQEKLYWAGVPVNQIYREFPQITTQYLASSVPLQERLNLGAWYFGQRRYGAAMLEFKAILKEEPNNPEALAYIGRIYHEQTKPDEAMKNYRRALSYNPKNFIALLFLTRACMDQGEFSEAINYAKRALEQKPNSSDCKIMTATSLMALNKLEEAREILKQMEEAGFNRWDMHYLLGILYVREGIAKNKIYQAGNKWCIEEGVKEKIMYHLNQSIKIKPKKNGVTYQELAQVAIYENDLQTAAKYLDTGIETDPQNTQLYLFACSLFFNNNKIELALDYVKKSLNIKETPEGMYWLGAILFKLQKFPECLEAFQASLELNPKYSLAHEALFFMGLVYVQKNNPGEAANCFRRSLKLKPDFALSRQALYRMGYKE